MSFRLFSECDENERKSEGKVVYGIVVCFENMEREKGNCNKDQEGGTEGEDRGAEKEEEEEEDREEGPEWGERGFDLIARDDDDERGGKEFGSMPEASSRFSTCCCGERC